METGKAVILAGGRGTRFYPITREMPKALLPVGRKPIISHLADLFLRQGAGEIFVLVSREFGDDFKWWKKRHYPKEDIFFVKEDKPLGTFGGLWCLKERLSGAPFFLANSDEIKEADLGEMRRFHERKGVVATIGLAKAPDARDYGAAKCENGLITEFAEKRAAAGGGRTRVSSGLYLLSPEAFGYHPGPRFAMVEKDLFPRLAREGKLGGFELKGRWVDCGTWEKYGRAVEKWRRQRKKT